MTSKPKTINIYTGSEITLCTPSHPAAAVMYMKRVIDRIVDSKDNEFSYNCNSIDGIRLLQTYGSGLLGLNVCYYINGEKKAIMRRFWLICHKVEC